MKDLGPGEKAPEQVNVVIEIPQGSLIKYEMDKESGMIMVDRFAFTTMGYPANYGYVPGTMSGDGDPVDVMVLSMYPIQPGAFIAAIPIGMLEMEDEAGVDAKVIAVPPLKVDPFFGKYQTIEEVEDSIKERIMHFFNHYKELEKNKWVKVTGWKGKGAAIEEVRKGMNK